MLENIADVTPFPALGDLKRNFILGDFGQGLFLFEFTGGDEFLLFLLNLSVQLPAGALLGALCDELSLHGQLQQRFSQVAGETAVQIVKGVINLFVTLHEGLQLFDLRDNALLLGKRGKRNF